MLFYKVAVQYPEGEKGFDTRSKVYCEAVDMFRKKSFEFAKKMKWKHYISLYKMSKKEMTLTIATDFTEDRAALICDQYLGHCGKEKPIIVCIEEIEYMTWRAMSGIESSVMNNFVSFPGAAHDHSRYKEITERMGLNHVFAPYSEDIIYEDHSFCKEKALSNMKNLLCGNTFAPELERIFAGSKNEHGRGHPVHYFIKGDDRFIKTDIEEILMRSLYANDRIDSKRYAIINIEDKKECERNTNNGMGMGFGDGRFINGLNSYDALYKLFAGATVIVRYTNDGVQEGTHAKISTGVIRAICDAAVKYKNETLTIITLQRNDTRVYEQFRERLDGMTFVTIEEEAAVGQTAKEYLKTCAENAHLEPNEELFSMIKGDAVSYNAEELKKIFDIWHSKILRTQLYPQYSEINNIKAIKDKPKGSAWQELDDLIGLKDAKEVIKRAINFHKAQKLFKIKGKQNTSTALHLVFSGNPGSAKTTVARLFAQILKDNGVLSVGELVECSRADLIGQYVGWTAPQVREKFRQAKGSVLFIDEAYSLCDPCNDRGSFGDEAINTIVQEMENRREDMVVIFAGYPKEMEHFLEQNPGLRSRIAFKVNFDDYNADELYRIVEFFVKKQELALDTGVKEKLIPILDAASKKVNFGNGRFVRNIFEQARMAQADRLVEKYPENVTLEDLGLLLPEDFSEPQVTLHEERRIGFGA